MSYNVIITIANGLLKQPKVFHVRYDTWAAANLRVPRIIEVLQETPSTHWLVNVSQSINGEFSFIDSFSSDDAHWPEPCDIPNPDLITKQDRYARIYDPVTSQEWIEWRLNQLSTEDG